MNSLEQMLEDYRNGKRGLPSYDELAALVAPQVVADERATYGECPPTPVLTLGLGERTYSPRAYQSDTNDGKHTPGLAGPGGDEAFKLASQGCYFGNGDVARAAKEQSC